ncbi:MAG: hypothetical protein VX619_07895 [bacterium]|nr:hypothetical protein [bacterium]
MLDKEDKEWIERLALNPWQHLGDQVLDNEEKNPYEDLISLRGGCSLLVNDNSVHLVDVGVQIRESLEAIWYYVNKLNKPLTCIFLSHKQAETQYFLEHYIYLKNCHPERFNFQLVCHQKNINLAMSGTFYGLIQDEEFIKLDGRSYFLAKAPGHSRRGDHMIIMEMRHKILFFGTLLQPQGESYEYCTFVTPISNHFNPDLVYKSILFLKSLPFEAGVSLHGEVLDHSRTYRWMEITQKIIERTSHYVRKSVWESTPSDNEVNDFRELAREVYLQLAIERNLDLDAAYKRLDEDEESFELYDRPMINFFIRKFQS